MQPKMGKMDIDYQVLHDAVFKYQTKPKLTTHGDLYHEGKEFKVKLKKMKPGVLSHELKEAFGMPDGAPPPRLINIDMDLHRHIHNIDADEFSSLLKRTKLPRHYSPHVVSILLIHKILIAMWKNVLQIRSGERAPQNSSWCFAQLKETVAFSASGLYDSMKIERALCFFFWCHQLLV